MKMYQSKKTIALMLSALLCVTFFFSLMFIITESDHDCKGERDCQICEQMNICMRFFKDTTPKPNAASAGLSVVFAVVLCIGFAAFAKKLNTPVERKDKLSN
jgi:hypothetical protein